MLFCNIDLLDENFALKRGQYVGVKDGKIAPVPPRQVPIMPVASSVFIPSVASR